MTRPCGSRAHDAAAFDAARRSADARAGFAEARLSVPAARIGADGSRWTPGHFVADELSIPLPVPVFPRPAAQRDVYTHALDRACYREARLNATFKTYAGIGHETNGLIKRDIATFFRANL